MYRHHDLYVAEADGERKGRGLAASVLVCERW